MNLTTHLPASFSPPCYASEESTWRLSWNTEKMTQMLRDSSPNLSPGVFIGLAAVRRRGAQLKSFHCGSPTLAWAVGLRGSGCLVGELQPLNSPCHLLFHQLHYQQCFQSIASLSRKFICQSHVGAHEWNSHLAQRRQCRGYLTSIASTWHGCPTAVLAEVPSPKAGRRWDSPPWGFISAGFVQTVSSYFMYISHFPSTSLHPFKFLVQLSTPIKISFNSQRVHLKKNASEMETEHWDDTFSVIEGCVICCFH